jgi:dTDP-4-amino-4,6-dideoxygalactose transaminase
MVAPIILANLEPAYYGIDKSGRPKVDTIDGKIANEAKAMLVSHYFGIAHSLADVRHWCDECGIALIEDCAHSYFGWAGERPIGMWGDFSTASLTKFLPMPEGGILASTKQPLSAINLVRQSLHAQIKGFIDVLEMSIGHGGFHGIGWALSLIFKLKNSRRRLKVPEPIPTEDRRLSDPIQDCDMGRIQMKPLWISQLLGMVLPRGRVITRRRKNFLAYDKRLREIAGARPISSSLPDNAVPYVFPLWVDDPDPLYKELRAQRLPVFRWDRIWPGTTRIAGDMGPLWSHHVLQLLCHQDLSDGDIEKIALTISRILVGQPKEAASPNPEKEKDPIL